MRSPYFTNNQKHKYMSCKLTKSLDKKTCSYAVAGARSLYLANYYPPVEGAAAVAGHIAYTFDSDGYLSGIVLPTGEKFFKVDGELNTISFGDELLVGGNGGKYRQHTVNSTIGRYDIDMLAEGDALALGRFIAIVVDKAGRPICLGRVNGLAAPAGGNNYSSGAADADANGWTLIMQGTSTEIAPLLLNEAVITPIFSETVVP